MFFKIRCIGLTSWRSMFLGFNRSTLASHICSTDSIPWVHHSREEGSIDYDERLVRLQVYLKFNTIIHRQQQLLFFAGRDEGAGDLSFGRRRYKRFVSQHDLRMQWRRHLANPCRDNVSLLRVSFNSTLESLPRHWPSWEPLPVSCALDLIPFSLFLEMMTTLVMFGWRC
jgi:hypothetical protein